MPNKKPPSLAERLKVTPVRRGPLCTVCKLPQDYLEGVNEAMPERRFKDLARLIQSDGHRHITHHMLVHHADHFEQRNG